ncbi:MAG TPA: hypothetical protein VHT27_08375 [Solirubrobacteraceae bacterium]|jgi:hypothetical protein|nr:hypothetical protein [Solirubrobacteraceae bacterium]
MMRSAVAFAALIGAASVLVLSGATAQGRSRSYHPERRFAITLAPHSGDLAVLELDFPARRGARVSAGSLQVAAGAVFGADYLARAAARGRVAGRLVALVLLANRPTGPAEPVSVRLRLRASRALGVPARVIRSDPFTTAVAPAPRCAVSDTALAGLVAIGWRGQPLTGFTPAAAVAAAYDAVCGRAAPPALRQAVAPAPPQCSPGALCCLPTAICAPVPAPPVGPGTIPPPPGCTPCDPRPGFACPLVLAPGACVAGTGAPVRKGGA